MATSKSKGAQAQRREQTRANLVLDVEAYQRLFVTSVMTKESAGDIVTRLINEHLKSYALPAKMSDRSEKHHRVVPSVEVNETPLENAA